MKNYSLDIFISFFLGASCGVSLFSINETNYKKRLSTLKDRVNNGFDEDKKKLHIDYLNISNDFKKSLVRLNPQIHETN